MDVDDEIRGSDEVEHGIEEHAYVTETNHALGKKVEHKHSVINEPPVHINRNAMSMA